MRRSALIAAAALLPFGLLVAWGLTAMRPERPPLVPPERVEPTPSAPAVVEPPRPLERVESPAPAPAPAPRPEPSPADEAAVRAAVVDQLNPRVHLCLLEVNGRLEGPLGVSTSFDTTEAGALTHVEVQMKSADPYLSACVQDALEGARLDPARGLPKGTMRHTFTFSPTRAR